MLVELWQVAVFIVALSFLVLTIYLVGVLQGLNRTMEQLRTVVGANSENIHAITNEIKTISKNATSITDDIVKDMDEINEAIESLNNTTQMVEETVQLSKDNVILPLMGLVNLGQGVKSATGLLKRNKK
jgi:uncharacterized protein YoxC